MKLQIRHPQAIRPWQHVLEPLSGYIKLAEKLWHQPALADAYNFGPLTHEAATVRKVVQLAKEAYGMGDVYWHDDTKGPHETGWLALEIAKARSILGVIPNWTLAEAVRRTMHWYLEYRLGADVLHLCHADITAFESSGELSQMS